MATTYFKTEKELDEFLLENGKDNYHHGYSLWNPPRYFATEFKEVSYRDSVENMATETYSRGGHYVSGGMYKRNNY